MQRLFGSDILHTWVLGFVEACVGFALQIIKYIGYANVDSTYSRSSKLLIEIVKKFPAYNSLQPTSKHVIFPDIYELSQAPSSKKASNPRHTTSILKMRESGKLPPAMNQIYYALADPELLPSDLNWARKKGFAEPYFSPQQVLINAFNAVLEVHWYLKSGSLTEGQLQTLQMLIANAQGHMLVLDVMRKRIIEKAITVKDKFDDIPADEAPLMSNVKFELISHLPEAMRQSGCNNNSRDTELGEMMMKLCKLLFADTSRKYNTVLRDMLVKYLHLQYMAIAEKGFLDANILHCLLPDARKSHNSSKSIATSTTWDFKTNSCYRIQKIVFRRFKFRISTEDGKWNVHPMLMLVMNI